ncbi:MAG TPA: CHAD domain-containing protein [Ignavibacteriaceae bacterium]|nr:CHAD domain-containing protein [Ignavibacteriaceae bacterium]
MKNKKWKIKGLRDDTPLSEASRIVLRQKLNHLVKSIKIYFINNTPENLHSLRISLRRLRYNLEIFISCFDDKKIVIFYHQVETLQDCTGNLRDLDVLLDNIILNTDRSYDEKMSLLIETIGVKKKALFEELRSSLTEFLYGKNLKEFKKMIHK